MPNFYGKRGARNLNSKTTAQAVALMRYLAQFKPWTLRALATEFGLSVPAVHKIVRGQSWTSIDVDKELLTLQRRAYLFKNPIGEDDETEREAAKVRCSSPYVVESVQVSTPRDAKVDKRTPSQLKTRQKYTLRDVLVELGVESIADVTQEMFDGLTEDKKLPIAAEG